MDEPLDLIGIGVGPFNLSLAALLEKTPGVRSVFFDKKPRFDWHPEVMFPDSTMQTSYMKDLVTPVDPTSPYSFLNYLVRKNLFYHFLNTRRSVISRREFEQYCVWASGELNHKIKFNTDVRGVSFSNGLFLVDTANGAFRARNICVATGLAPRIPDCATGLIGPHLFHAKSARLREMNAEGKSVVIVGGGQTGIEIFRNMLHGKWGHAGSVRLITRRRGLEPLDESAFTNECFTPSYADSFWGLELEKKAQIVASQKLASDGNTPAYLLDLYTDLYRLKHVEHDSRDIQILACRNLLNIEKHADGFRLAMENTFLDKREELCADIVILSTGFQNVIPGLLEPLFPRIRLDANGRFRFRKSYAIEWDGPEDNRIYALNFSRHSHGIIDPQTSLMAWRSAVVVNDLTKTNVYATEPAVQNFIQYEGDS